MSLRDPRSSMLYWYPKIQGFDIPQPHTEIMSLTHLPQKAWFDFLEEGKVSFDFQQLKRICRRIGYPLFLRTDQASGKHHWKKSCFIQSEAILLPNLRTLIDLNLAADIIGLSIQALVVRSYIPMAELFTAFYGYMPVNPEIRCFVRDGSIQCWHWYWIEEAIVNPSVDNWREILENTKRTIKTADLEDNVLRYAQIVADIFRKDGYWSVDFCKTKAGPWMLIDMAEGERSWHPECSEKESWRGCYRGDPYRKYWTSESYAHPAKIAPRLVDRILDYLKHEGYLTKDSIIVDFMAGTGRVNLIAALRGYRTISVELEEHFIKMAEGIKAQAERITGRKLPYTIIQGDARQLSQILKERGFVGVVSPPYQDTINASKHIGSGTRPYVAINVAKNLPRPYSSSPDNIGNLRDSSIIDQEPPSYLSAMLQVYREAYRCGISPLVTVTKNPTRNGKLRRLDLDTISILQQSGYEVFAHKKAVLFTERKQATLTGQVRRQFTGRISFFKRLSLSKGNVAASHEDVTFARIPQVRKSGTREPRHGNSDTC